MRAVIRYPGSKWSLAEWIISHFPEEYEKMVYLEPFAGSGAVFFSKKPGAVETINDLDGDIVNLFRVLRDRPEELKRLLELTPYSREEYDRAFEACDDPIEKARRYMVKTTQAIGAKMDGKSGWRNHKQPKIGGTACKWAGITSTIDTAATRLRGGTTNLVQIEHMDALRLIERYNSPDVLMYLILFESAGVPGDTYPSGAETQGVTGGVAGGVDWAEGSSRTAYAVYDCRGNGSGGIAPTITGDHQNRVTDYTAVCVRGYELNQISSPTNRSNPRSGDPAPTLSATGCPGVTYCMMSSQEHSMIGDDVAGTISCKHETPIVCTGVETWNFRETGDVVATLQAGNHGYTINAMHAVRYGHIIRRLTPVECERLQGYPDGWTDIPDYIDSRGKRRKASDSARYTALGNSIALPQWRYVLGNISRYLPHSATLGSLFDGIGGFPLIWEEIHGAGSARWASEINEFCIAVTRYRFAGYINQRR